MLTSFRSILTVYRAFSFELVYVSSDTDEGAMLKDFKDHHPGWLAMPLGEQRATVELKRRFKVQSIPVLIVLGPDGSVISENGRTEIERKRMQAVYIWLVAAKLFDAVKLELMSKTARLAL